MALGTTMIVDRTDLQHLVVRPLAISDDAAPAEGSVLLAVDLFALSANNVTYATSGPDHGYWTFFPAVDGWGGIPTWGHATVLASGHPSVAEGDTYFGLLPMATHLLVAPTRVGPRGFSDGSPHRAASAPLYNRYLDRATDPVAGMSPSASIEVLLRNQFTTSFLLEAELASNDWYGAEAVVITSASSRTAMGAAHVITRRGRRPAVIGLTRADRVDDLRSMGSYDRVLAYEDITALPVGPTAVVDLCGDGPVVAALHHHLGPSLTSATVVGATHRHAPRIDAGALPGAPRRLFIGPEVADRIRERFGEAAVEAKLAAAWGDFATSMDGWLRIHRAVGADAVSEVYASTLAGSAAPRDAWVCSMRR